jgi:MYXO-CTERM domain-containing protein
MKLSHLYKLSGAGFLAISLAVIPFSALAQAQTGTDSGTDSTEVVTTEDDNSDWGWLGLLGLLGLAGLAGKKNNNTHREVGTAQPFPDTPSRRID